MKKDVVKKTFYLNRALSDHLDSEKARTHDSISEIISNALIEYFKKSAVEEAEKYQGPLMEEVQQISNETKATRKAVEAAYRNIAYLVGLSNCGMIHDGSTYKYNYATKSLARKKALRNYQKLKSGELTLEDYLVELDEDMTNFEKEEYEMEELQKEEEKNKQKNKNNFSSIFEPVEVINTNEPVKVEEPKHEEPRRSSFSDWFGN